MAARAGAEVPAATDRLPARRPRDHLGRADLPRGAQRARPTPPTRAPTCSASTRQRRYVGADGRTAHQPPQAAPAASGRCCITDHHRGFIDWDTYQANQARIGANTRPRAHQPGTGAVREGCALLQGLATCGTCGRKLAVYYDGPAQGHARLLLHRHRPARRGPRHPAPARRRRRDRRRGRRRVPGRAGTRRAAGLPGRRPATRGRPRRRAARSGAARSSSARYAGQPRPNAATGPSTPTTGWSPAAWRPSGNTALHQPGRRRGRTRPPRGRAPENPDPDKRNRRSWPSATTSAGVWSAATTTDRDRKQLLRTLLDEVNISVHRDHDRRPRRAARCAGRAARSPNCPCRSNANHPAAAHRRGHHRPAAPPRRPLPRRHDRRHPQPARTAAPPADCRSPPVGSSHCATTGTSPATSPATTRQEGELLTVADAAARTRPRPLHPAPLAGRRVHRRRAAHPRRALADPPHRRHPRPVRRRRPRRLAGHARGHPRLRRLPPNHHAACQARRTPSRPRPHRTPKRPAYPAPTHPRQPVLIMTINERSSVTMHPRRPGRRYRVPSPVSNTAFASPPMRHGHCAPDGSHNCPDGRSAPA